MSTSSPFRWSIQLFDKYGNFVADLSNSSSRWWNPGPINGVDTMGFSLSVNDPKIALLSEPLKCRIKMWRYIDDPIYGVHRTPLRSKPDFVGTLSGRAKSGRIITFTASGPMWQPQCHFHVHHHRLKDPLRVTVGVFHHPLVFYSIPATFSGLMWKVLDLVQTAFWLNHQSDFGIRFDPAVGTGNDPGRLGYYVTNELGTAIWNPGVYQVPKNSWPWDDHITFFLGQMNAPDIHLKLNHVDGSPILAYWWCDWPGRGADKSGQVKIAYGISPHNCDTSFDYQEQYTPKEWGNYARLLGTGDSSTTLTQDEVIDELNPDSGVGLDDVGVYMFQEQYNNIVDAGLLKATMDKDLLKHSAKPETYTVQPTPVKPPYYDVDYTLGDVLMFESIDGYDHVGPLKMRVMDCKIVLSDNDKETVTLTVVTDNLEKVVGT